MRIHVEADRMVTKNFCTDTAITVMRSRKQVVEYSFVTFDMSVRQIKEMVEKEVAKLWPPLEKFEQANSDVKIKITMEL